MRIIGIVLGVVAAIGMHLGFLLFGGLLFLSDEKDSGTLQQVELLSDDASAEKEEEKPQDPAPEESTEAMESETEPPPDAAEILKSLELSEAARAPELEAASLSAIEAALSGLAGSGGDFAQSLDFASGGRIGGTGKASALEDNLEGAFSLAEIDQRPRAVFQASPLYPSDMRGKKLEGVVTLVFIVSPEGKVASPRVEKSTHTSFEKPALDAVRQWKFEPAIRGGLRVACKMRVPIRFQPN